MNDTNPTNVATYFPEIKQEVEKLGIAVSEVEADSIETIRSFRGAFNGNTVFLIKDGSPEESVFTLLHAVGHLAQWAESPEEKAYSYEMQSRPLGRSREEIERHYQHELASAEYTLGFLEGIGLGSLSEWFTEYFYADQLYIHEYLTSGKLGGVQRFFAFLRRKESFETLAKPSLIAKHLPKVSIVSDSADHIFII